MLDGLRLEVLKRIPDERGCVMHGWKWRSGAKNNIVNEVYATTIRQGVVKGWHLHKQAITRYIPVVGEVLIVLLDPRRNSSTNGEAWEVVLGERNYHRLEIPPGLWIGMKGLAEGESMLLNVTDYTHEPHEMLRLDPHAPVKLGPGIETDYAWRTRDR